MRKLVVVNDPRHWHLDVEGVEVVSSRAYLTSGEYSRPRNVRVFNLCEHYRYRSKGYYVSLLAEARGQRVIPNVKTIQDLKTPTIVRIVSDELDLLVQRSLRHLRSEEFSLSIYFGENLAKQYARLSEELYQLFRAPLLRARFTRGRSWTLQGIRPIPLSEIPEEHLPFLQEVANRYFARQRYESHRTDRLVYDLGILHDPEERSPPSDPRALRRFVEAAEDVGFSVEMITREDYPRVGEFDALFIRETTAVDHHTYRFARRAQSEGIPVIDDPDSILRCTNKVYLAELLESARIPAPKTLIAHMGNRTEVEQALGLPCVLKVPDAAFSLGVEKVTTPEELEDGLRRMLAQSELVVAQRYTPTDFDWRIGVLEGEALWACKYFMARGHWQIYDWSEPQAREGDWETVPVEKAPPRVVENALRATKLIGNGLYGVDLKEIDGEAYVVEVNDNPNVDADVEDQVLGEEIYLRIVRALRARIERRAGMAPNGGTAANGR